MLDNGLRQVSNEGPRCALDKRAQTSLWTNQILIQRTYGHKATPILQAKRLSEGASERQARLGKLVRNRLLWAGLKKERLAWYDLHG